MVLKKPYLPEAKKLRISQQMIAEMHEDIVCDRLYVTSLQYIPPTEEINISGKNVRRYVFLYLRQGRVTLSSYGTLKRFSAGQYFILPEGESYSLTPAKKETCELTIVKFGGTMCKEATRNCPKHPVTLIGTARREVEQLLTRLYGELSLSCSIGTMRYATCIFSHLMAFLSYGNGRDPEEKEVPVNNSKIAVESAMQYLRDHVEERVRLEELASFCGYTPTYFSSLFRRKTGYSPITYFNILKMQRACELLTSTRSRILDICAQLGIDDNYYFSRLFTKIIGMSPKQYRKTHTGKKK